ncbi:MAG: Rrf2 family transcriptional regulator [Gemmataceae bacterium]|nr:Rrf2 family transcriptional regulator [Gemmataceae bacterium]MDW8265620.1 Rrf2 family transcriptional regulator [Gemmataceae bacterium]
MALLSRKVDYALLILWYLHHHPEGGCARAIAGRFGLSRAFVANILKELCHRGLVTSHRGVKGGYLLHRPAQEVSLAELMEALDESFRFAECNRVDPISGCSLAGICPVKGPVGVVHNRIREVLRTITLAELFPALQPPERPAGRVPVAVATVCTAANL